MTDDPEFINYRITKDTFPLNKKVEQHLPEIKKDDIIFECTLLAGEVLGVECDDTVMTGREEFGDINPLYKITPDPYNAKTKEARENYTAFINYFEEHFGKRKGDCYFDTAYEACVNLVKAWIIWTKLLAPADKEKYFE